MALGIGTIISAGASILGGVMSGDASKDAASAQARSGEAAISEQKRQFDIGQQNLKPYQDVGKAALYKLSDYLGLPGVAPGFDQAGYDDAMRLWNAKDAGGNYWQRVGPEPTRDAYTTTIDPSDKTGSLLKPFSFDISQDPGYEFRKSEGEKGVENSAAARGSQLSGATLKELLRYGSDYASGEYNAAFNRDLATKNQIYGQLTGVAGMGAGATTTGVQAGNTLGTSIGNTMTGIGNANAAGIVGGSNAMSAGLSGAGNAISQAQLLKSIIPNPGVAAVNSGVNLDT